MKRILPVVAAAGVLAAVALLAAACTFVQSDALNQAALAGNPARCAHLVSRGAKVNGAGMHAMKPIMSAARSGSLETVQCLISLGADVNAHNDSGSALMWAVDSGNESVVRFLLMNGADLGWTNSLGGTALNLAREKNATNMVRILDSWRMKGPPNDPALGSQPIRAKTNQTSSTPGDRPSPSGLVTK